MTEADKLLDELFAEDDELDETSSEGNPPPVETPPPADPPSDTKAFSERLKKEKEKMAKQLGYDS